MDVLVENNAKCRDQAWMKRALALAKQAGDRHEVPVGALVVQEGKIISTGYNLRERLKSPIAHAELIAIQKASQLLGRWRLNDCSLYVTLEPCVMCAGALIQARLGRIVFGAFDPKAGAAVSLFNILSDSRLNHQIEIEGGVLEDDCSQLLKSFFQKKRRQNKNPTF